MKAPSTAWTEHPADDEEARFEAYAAQFAELQRSKSQKHGVGRVLHRKQHLGLSARVEVVDDLPEHARHGLFASPGSYDARVRLSNGGTDRAADKRPDVRGFAIKVLGVSGPGALGGDTAEQDFLLINHPAFGFPSSDEFVGLVMSSSRGQLALIRYLIGRYGLFGGIGQLRRLARTFGAPFSGFALQPMFSAAPIACGPYAAKVRLLPQGHSPTPPALRTDWSADIVQRLAGGDLQWALQLQFYVDDATTPIEDASVVWLDSEAPFTTVARLVIPQQNPNSDAGRALADEIEAAHFDPWNALADHRPLGEIMRARKATYLVSQQGRQR